MTSQALNEKCKQNEFSIMFILEFKNHAYVFLNCYTGKIIGRINSLCRHLEG